MPAREGIRVNHIGDDVEAGRVRDLASADILSSKFTSQVLSE